MSFTSFGPTPTPSLPLSAPPVWRIAPRRPASAVPTTPAGWETGGTLPGPAWQVSERVLAGIDPDARHCLRRLFTRTLEAVEADLALPPARRHLVPVPYLVQHLGRPRFQTEELRQQDQKGLGRLLRQALWRAIDALEAAALLPPGEVYQSLLAEQCAQFERVYQELKRRAGRCFALLILQGELRLLHYRGSASIEHLLFE